MTKDQKTKRSKKPKGRVFPNEGDDIDGSLANDGFELDSIDEIKKNNRKKYDDKSNKFKLVANVAKDAIRKRHPLDVIANVKNQAAKWKHYATGRRQAGKNAAGDSGDRRTTGGIGLE